MGMMYFNVEEDKIDDISQNIEKGLIYIGKAMSCVEEMRKEPGMMGERRGGRYYGNRYGRMGMRDGMQEDDEMPEAGVRRSIGMRGAMGYRDPYYY